MDKRAAWYKHFKNWWIRLWEPGLLFIDPDGTPFSAVKVCEIMWWCVSTSSSQINQSKRFLGLRLQPQISIGSALPFSRRQRSVPWTSRLRSAHLHYWFSLQFRSMNNARQAVIETGWMFLDKPKCQTERHFLNEALLILLCWITSCMCLLCTVMLKATTLYVNVKKWIANSKLRVSKPDLACDPA